MLDEKMTADRCHQILKTAAFGAGGYILQTERAELIDSGLMIDTPEGLVLTTLGRKALANT